MNTQSINADDSRIRSLYRGGSRFIARQEDGTWGIAHTTLHLLLVTLRGSPYDYFSGGIWEIHGSRHYRSGGLDRGGKATHLERVYGLSAAAHAIVKATEKQGLRAEPFVASLHPSWLDEGLHPKEKP